MKELLTDPPKIDGRSLADLLDYFVQLSGNINYYDENLQTSDWTPFFEGSLPFQLASIIKTKPAIISEKFTCYDFLFKKSPSRAGLQLTFFYVYLLTIRKIDVWYTQVKGSQLPIELFLAKLIKNKLQQPLKTFVGLYNAAVKYYCIRNIDFTSLSDIWGLQVSDIHAIDESFLSAGNSNRKRLLALELQLNNLFPMLIESFNVLTVAAEQDLPASLLPVADSLQKKHSPHLALIFVFLKMFQELQKDINGYTRKHLDFFYQEVLQLKPKPATADKANVLFELQNQLQKHLIAKGVLVKDGKDNNKAEILFSVDDDLVVNKTTVSSIRTLYLNSNEIQDTNYLEGVYIATDATKADGTDKPFKDDEPANYPTVGAKESKYIAPGTDFFKPYQGARLGFILASPVLFLNEGKRTVNITLACQLFDPSNLNQASPICQSGDENGDYPNFYSTQAIFNKVRKLFRKYYVYISMELINAAETKGISEGTIQFLKDNFLAGGTKLVCDNNENIYLRENTVTWGEWWNKYYNSVNPQEKAVIDELFPKRRILKLAFSGAKDWIQPSQIKRIRLTPLVVNAGKMTFAIHIKAVVKEDKPAVVFYNKLNLKEDFNTTLPLVKIELDDLIKIKRGIDLIPGGCCLERPLDNNKIPLSFYYFLRNLRIIEATDPDSKGHVFTSGIQVKVCGLKNFIVQNDESVQDVNSPIYPFGTRPKVDAHFFIGSEEIFLKKWDDIYVNLNWKDLPDPLPSNFFENYYNGYQDYEINTGVSINVVKDANFKIQIAILQDGIWKDWNNCTTGTPPKYDCSTTLAKCRLFQDFVEPPFCQDEDYLSQFTIDRTTDFGTSLDSPKEKISYLGFKRLDVNTRNSFIRITLKCQDFQHDKYPFVLARQMAALGKLPDVIDGAVYFGVVPGSPPYFKTVDIKQILEEIVNTYNLSKAPIDLDANLQDLIARIISFSGAAPGTEDINMWMDLFTTNVPAFSNPPAGKLVSQSDYYQNFKTIMQWLQDKYNVLKDFVDRGVVIPKEPWTPIISSMSLDYTAHAGLDEIDLIHLYPYAGTFKHEEIQLQPTLFPSFCDEGTLFLGLQNFVPGENLNVLFQLAEATSDSESDPEKVFWHYLDSNAWKPLRTGFEVLNDDTENLTTTGIIKFSLPENMTNDNTIMPSGLHWIKVTTPKNSAAVSETTGIFTQAISVTFTNEKENDKLRLNTPLAGNSITKLQVPDAGIKQVSQPYESFGGAQPELQEQYYVRVSELLRHKGRAIQKFDYERLALEAFPELFKVKCINHSYALNAHRYFNDFPMAPGYVLLAVIPDLNILKAGNSFEPKAPVSILEKMEEYLQQRTSPFVRLRAMNPRYETVHFSIKVKLLPGKDKNFFKEQLAKDIRTFLAPWAIGDYYKLTFGQCVNRSQVIQYIETRNYVDYILELKMYSDETGPGQCEEPYEICPVTPRSILIAGDIDVCIPDKECEEWGRASCKNLPVPIKDYCKK